MDKKLSKAESIMVGKWIEEKSFDKLEDWIADDSDRAKMVFCHYRSLSTLKEMEAVLHPSQVEKLQLARELAKSEIKRVVISFWEDGLKLISGEKYQQLPQMGLARSDEEMNFLDFSRFKIFPSDDRDSPYELRLGKSEYVAVDKIGDIKERIYEGKKINGFSLSLESGKYRIEVNQEFWELELK